MIHVRHTSSAELARRRIRLLVYCIFCVLGLCTGIAFWAKTQITLILCGDAACNFQGVTFAQEPPIPPEKKNIRQPSPARPIYTPQLLVQVHPETALPELELTALEPYFTDEQPDSPLLEIAELCPPLPATKTAAPPIAGQGPTQSKYTPPAYLNCPHPSYPPRLRKQRIEGSVGVRITVAADGAPSEVVIISTSGNAQLDRHTRNWILQQWRFTPAKNDNQPVVSVVETQVRFLLNA